MQNSESLTWRKTFIYGGFFALVYFALSLMRVRMGADLNVYIRAALTSLAGANPYVVDVINRSTAGLPILESMPFYASPMALTFFMPLTLLDAQKAMHVFDFVMALAFGVSTSVLLRIAQPQPDCKWSLSYAVVALFGFGFPVFCTIIFQNAEPIECASITTGIYFILRRRIFIGSILFLPSIVLKLQPVVLLAMILILIEKSRVRIVVGLLLPIALGLAIPAILRPDLMINWINGMMVGYWLSDPGDFSILRLLYTFGLSKKLHLIVFEVIWAGLLFFLPWYISVNCCKLQNIANAKRVKLLLCMLCVVTYLLMIPRLKPYLLILAVPTVIAIVAELPILLIALLPTFCVFIFGAFTFEIVHIFILISLFFVWMKLYMLILNERKLLLESDSVPGSCCAGTLTRGISPEENGKKCRMN